MSPSSIRRARVGRPSPDRCLEPARHLRRAGSETRFGFESSMTGSTGTDQSGDQIGDHKPPKPAEVAEAAEGQKPTFPRKTSASGRAAEPTADNF
jgi:hypothetical protein